MADKTYSIVFDVADDRLDLRSLHSHVKEDASITNWWNHLPSLFIIVTPLSAKELGRRVHAWLGDVSFVLMEVDPDSTFGYLPTDAALWLERRRYRHTVETTSSERV